MLHISFKRTFLTLSSSHKMFVVNGLVLIPNSSLQPHLNNCAAVTHHGVQPMKYDSAFSHYSC